MVAVGNNTVYADISITPHSNNKIDWKNVSQKRRTEDTDNWSPDDWSAFVEWFIDWFLIDELAKEISIAFGKWFKREDAIGSKTGQETVGLTKRFALKQIKVCVDALSRRTLDLLEVSETADMNHVHKITSVSMWTCEPCYTNTSVWTWTCEPLFTVTSILIYQWTDCLERCNWRLQSILFLCSAVFIVVRKGQNTPSNWLFHFTSPWSAEWRTTSQACQN